MKIRRLLLAAAILFAALPAFAAPAPAVQLHAASPAVQPASPPALADFLASLAQPAPQRAASCGPSFCTQAQRDACNQQCRKQGHTVFVGLECCRDCTTLCICGSKPVNC